MLYICSQCSLSDTLWRGTNHIKRDEYSNFFKSWENVWWYNQHFSKISCFSKMLRVYIIRTYHFFLAEFFSKVLHPCLEDMKSLISASHTAVANNNSQNFLDEAYIFIRKIKMWNEYCTYSWLSHFLETLEFISWWITHYHDGRQMSPRRSAVSQLPLRLLLCTHCLAICLDRFISSPLPWSRCILWVVPVPKL